MSEKKLSFVRWRIGVRDGRNDGVEVMFKGIPVSLFEVGECSAGLVVGGGVAVV